MQPNISIEKSLKRKFKQRQVLESQKGTISINHEDRNPQIIMEKNRKELKIWIFYKKIKYEFVKIRSFIWKFTKDATGIKGIRESQ